MENNYDILIIGGGVAGMSAAIYAKRRNKNVAILEKFALGGQVATLSQIENFPSQTEIDGFSLSQMFAKQVKALGVEVVRDEMKSFDFSGETKTIYGKKGEYRAKSVIIASGMKSVDLGANEAEFLGRGVSYCVTCDANFYKGKQVCVASKNGSGVLGAKELLNVCSKVLLLDSGDMSKYASVNKDNKLEIFSKVEIKKLLGGDKLEKIEVDVDGKSTEFETDALFIELGKIPATQNFRGVLELDEKGFIKTDTNMRTSVKGVFAVGDVRSGFLKQIVVACSDGAIAGQLA